MLRRILEARQPGGPLAIAEPSAAPGEQTRARRPLSRNYSLVVGRRADSSLSNRSFSAGTATVAGAARLELPMAKTDFKFVDQYIAAQPEAVQGILERVRGAIRKAVPAAEEMISYQIPTYKLHGSPVLSFAGWRQHYSLYGATDHLRAAFKDDLAPFEVSKGTIRFPLSEPIPVKLIERIAKFRAKEAAARVQVKMAD